MASSSSIASNSQYRPRWKYVVFLSFRGIDTRNTFTCHLYEGLENRGINTFLDDKRIEDGESIPEELPKAIEVSQFALVVFSKNFATSRWCLNELVKIMECNKQENGQTVIPIFYDVDPSHVRNQTGDFAKAFEEYELKYKDDVEGMQKVQQWRTALTAAANLKGRDIRGNMTYLLILDFLTFSTIDLLIYVGMKQRKFSRSSTKSLARVVILYLLCKQLQEPSLTHLSYQFKAACFLADVKENAKRNQLHSLQNMLLSELLRKEHNYVNNKFEGQSMIPERLRYMKVLIVLDDIDHSDHLEYLAGGLHWFGGGSRVVITTRNRQLIVNADKIYEVPALPDDEAMLLFNQHAFKNKIPDERFKVFSLEVVNHAKGLPLALKSPKSKRCSWIWHVSSEDMIKLESYDKGAECGLDVLIDKSLVFISEYDMLEMHHLTEDMGRYVESKAVESIWLHYYDSVDKKLRLSKEVMKNMKRLKILCINEFDTHDAIEYLPNSLAWIHIFGYPWESLPEDFEPKTLVHPELREGLLRHLWFETKHFPCLRKLNLGDSQNLMQTPDFSGMPNLEHLDLGYCQSLKEVHHSLGNCRKLIHLSLDRCESLERFPYVSGESLEYLNLEDCSSLEIFPEVMGNEALFYSVPNSGRARFASYAKSCDLENLEELDARFTLISRPPSSIVRLNKLKFLSFEKYTFNEGVLFVFPRVNKGLRSLKILNLCRCNLVDEGLLEDIGCLHSLEELQLSGNNFEHFPLAQLGALRCLGLSHCEKINFELIMGMKNLETLNLSCCNLIDGELPDDIGCLSSLKELNLSGNNFGHLPRSIAQLGALRCLDVSHCMRFTWLPEFPLLLDTIEADWTNYRICNSLFRNLSLLQHDISASDSLSLRAITSLHFNEKPWFPYQGIDGVPVDLPENWYIHDSFLGFAVCYNGRLMDITAHLIPLSDDGMSCITQKLVLSNHSVYSQIHYGFRFFVIPFAGLWDISKANGKTPNDYRHIMLSSSEKNKYEFRLLYKDEHNDEHCPGTRRSRFDDSEHHDEASCSSSKKQSYLGNLRLKEQFNCREERWALVFGLLEGGHEFKSWKQPLAEMQGKAVYNTPLWWGPSPDPTHSESFNALFVTKEEVAAVMNCVIVNKPPGCDEMDTVMGEHEKIDSKPVSITTCVCILTPNT
ncbi:hypothetical protein T459_29162 [Capsicum annuum]|uniref:ADP-ribosyl cyclase/cyclic ADP-ribose hydrolase n=1 Tax=Capsicum annuum TaxID=4072 RepID=A0A2G2Y4P9_CAPAN|nr:hypothetical protein T459_29162 [Capsicum annuum]